MMAFSAGLLLLSGCTLWQNLTDKTSDSGVPMADSGGSTTDDTNPSGDDTNPGGDDTNPGGDDTGQGGGELDVDCDPDAYSSAAPGGPDCLTQTLSCGDTVYGTTAGGDNLLEEDFYTASFCFVPFSDYDGPERVYAVEVPASTRISVHFDTSCTNMGHAVFRWEDETRCPYGDQFLVNECEGDTVGRGGTESIDAFNASRFLIVVDGPEGSSGNFGISIECEEF